MPTFPGYLKLREESATSTDLFADFNVEYNLPHRYCDRAGGERANRDWYVTVDDRRYANPTNDSKRGLPYAYSIGTGSAPLIRGAI